MKPAHAVVTLLVVVAVIALCAGCGERSGDATPSPAATVTATATPAYTHPLQKFSLTKEDIPFTVMTEKRQDDLKPDPADPVSRYAPVSVYAVTFAEGSGETETERVVSQLIYELSEQNASYAVSDIYSEAVQASNPANKDVVVVMDPTMKVGDQAVGFYVRYPGSTKAKFAQNEIAFRKGKYYVVLMSQSPQEDLGGLKTLAEKAAAWIPGGRPASSSPAPASTADGGGGLVPVYPFTVTAGPANTITSISFTITTPAGTVPLDAGKTSFNIQVPSMGGKVSPAPGDTTGKQVVISTNNYRDFTTGDGKVSITWKKTVGEQNNILEPGEAATITLDFAGAGWAPPAKNVRQGVAILVKGPTGGTQFPCGNVPEVVKAGSRYDCW